MPLLRALIFVNPRAGRGATVPAKAQGEAQGVPDAPAVRYMACPAVRAYEDTVRPMLIAYCYELKEHFAEARGDVYQAAVSEDTSSTHLVVVVGGDGTLHEVMNGLLRSRSYESTRELPPVVVVPCGTGNAIAGACGIRSPADAVRALEDCDVLPLGLAKVSASPASAASAAPAPAGNHASKAARHSAAAGGGGPHDGDIAVEPAYAIAVVSLGMHAATALGGKRLRFLGRARFALSAYYHCRLAPRQLEGKLTLSGARKLTTGADADTHEPFAPRAPSVALDGPFWYVLATPCERLTSSFRIAPWAMGTPQRMRKYPQDMAARRSVPGDMGVDGGEWDVVVVRCANASTQDVWRMLSVATSGGANDITDLPFVEYFKARGLSFAPIADAPNPVLACVDGEPLLLPAGGRLDMSCGAAGVALLGLHA